VDVAILDLVPDEQIAALLDRRIDLGFVPLPVVPTNQDLEFELVREVELMVALPPGHPLAKQRQLTLQKLAHEPLISLRPPSAVFLHHWVLNLCRAVGFEPQVTRMAESPASMLETVSAGFGVALVPSLFQRFPSDVVFRPLPPATPKFHLSLAWRRGDESPLLKGFLAILRTQIAQGTRRKTERAGSQSNGRERKGSEKVWNKRRAY
jgi:DNA-binding transcriptional LysR family regulator